MTENILSLQLTIDQRLALLAYMRAEPVNAAQWILLVDFFNALRDSVSLIRPDPVLPPPEPPAPTPTVRHFRCLKTSGLPIMTQPAGGEQVVIGGAHQSIGYFQVIDVLETSAGWGRIASGWIELGYCEELIP